jgi:hypothetical protein
MPNRQVVTRAEEWIKSRIVVGLPATRTRCPPAKREPPAADQREFLLHFVQAIQGNREFLLQFINAGWAARIAGGSLLSEAAQRQSHQGYGNQQETFPEPAAIPLQMVPGWLRHTSLLGVKVNSQHGREYIARPEPLDSKHPEADYVADLIAAVSFAITQPEAGMGGSPRSGTDQ